MAPLVWAAAAVGLAIVLWGGYDHHWSWTGFGANATLWDWLHLLLLPVAFGALPLLMRPHPPLDRRRRAVLMTLAAAFVAFVAVGYALDLTWTGFPGNRLWDWLELLVLPLVLALWPVWQQAEIELRARHRLGIALLAIAAVVVIVGGYAMRWTWTGFTGNTLFDWIQLLLLPVVLPTVVLPAAMAWMALEERQEEEEAAGP
jgi:hypothetical protein